MSKVIFGIQVSDDTYNAVSDNSKKKLQRNERTTVGQLRIGDRFYKSADKNKTVFQYVEFRDMKHLVKKDNERYPEPLNQYTNIIFLRNANDEQ